MADRLMGSAQTRADIESELKNASWWNGLSTSDKDQILSVLATATDEMEAIYGSTYAGKPLRGVSVTSITMLNGIANIVIAVDASVSEGDPAGKTIAKAVVAAGLSLVAITGSGIVLGTLGVLAASYIAIEAVDKGYDIIIGPDFEMKTKEDIPTVEVDYTLHEALKLSDGGLWNGSLKQLLNSQGLTNKDWALKSTNDNKTMRFDFANNMYVFLDSSLSDVLKNEIFISLALFISDNQGRVEFKVECEGVWISLKSLYGYSVNEIMQMAKEDKKVLHALENLNNFVVLDMEGGGVELYTSKNSANDYSDMYLQERAQMLAIIANDLGTNGIVYEDKKLNILRYSGWSTGMRGAPPMVIFGEYASPAQLDSSLVGTIKVFGGDESETIITNGNDDYLEGGKGNDTLKGGMGNDTYYFGIGHGSDTIEDVGDKDTILFGKGITKDDLVAFAGKDSNDLIIAIKEDGKDFSELSNKITIKDWYTKENRIEQIKFTDNENTVLKENDILLLLGTEKNDYIKGTENDNILEGKEGSDTLEGGKGNDTIYTNANIDTKYDNEDNNTINTVIAGQGSDTIYGSKGKDIVYGDDKENEGNNWSFTDDDDIIKTYGGDDRVYGGNDSDIIEGGSGNDTLYGGDDDDEIYAYYKQNSTDKEGTDENTINILYGEEGDDKLYGDKGKDYLYGGDDTDMLYGGDGDDYLDGGKGTVDYLEGGKGFDTYIANSGDIIKDEDGKGKITFKLNDTNVTIPLKGGYHKEGDPKNVYRGLYGETYKLSGSTLRVEFAGQSITIQNFNKNKNDLGIYLGDAVYVKINYLGYDDDSVNFEAVLSAPVGFDVRVDYELTNLSASSGLDYIDKNGGYVISCFLENIKLGDETFKNTINQRLYH